MVVIQKQNKGNCNSNFAGSKKQQKKILKKILKRDHLKSIRMRLKKLALLQILLVILTKSWMRISKWKRILLRSIT